VKENCSKWKKLEKLDITESVYFDIIKKKTASLISSCCGIGAASSGANEETIRAMQEFGMTVGMAFQIKDDLLDYGEADIGKTNRN
jgi:octaprenyl-diphosphate synthase